MIFNPYIYILHAIPKDQILTAGYIKNAIGVTSGLGIGHKKAKKLCTFRQHALCIFSESFLGYHRHQKHMEIEANFFINSMLLPC